MTRPSTAPASAQSVRPPELFFDLVFVFAITQIASVLAVRPTGVGLARVTALLAITWWMYGGYAWLTNALDLDRTGARFILLTGMAAFFVMSVAVPRSFESGPWGLVLALSYLVVVLVHGIGFLGTSGHRGIARIGPLNLVSALIVVAAGAGPQGPRVWLIALAAVVQVVTPFIAGLGGFTVGVGHFVERHGLAVIILLGESIAEVGSAAAVQHGVLEVVAGSLLALTLSAGMWWLYFDREERDSEHLLSSVPVEQRARVALYSFGYAYFMIVLGIAITAVGMQKAVSAFDHGMRGLSQGLLALGMALFLAGLAYFHRTLARNWSRVRLLGAAGAFISVPAARWVGGWLALASGTAVLVCLILTERPKAARRVGIRVRCSSEW